MTPKKSSLTRMADHELRRLVLERDGYRCRRCNRIGASGFLEAAHFVKRARRRTRWDLRNVVALCIPCHRYLDTHPLAKDEWIIEQIGEETYRELRRTAEDGKKTDTREVLEELRAMRRART